VTPLLCLKPAPQPLKQLPILYHFLREHSSGFSTWDGLGLTQGYASRYEHPKLKFQSASPAKMANFGLIFATYFDQLLSTEGLARRLLFKIELAAWTAQEELSKHGCLTSALQPSGGAGRAKSALALPNFGPFSGTFSPICMLAPKKI